MTVKKLRAHYNVIDLAEARREREQKQPVHFVGWCTEPSPEPNHLGDFIGEDAAKVHIKYDFARMRRRER